jgi:tetratricopeptide (TPR) repeat protein
MQFLKYFAKFAIIFAVSDYRLCFFLVSGWSEFQKMDTAKAKQIQTEFAPSIRLVMPCQFRAFSIVPRFLNFVVIVYRWFLLVAVFTSSIAVAQNSPPSILHFSARPTASEISSARIFDEPLIPIGGEPSANENRALADAMLAYATRTNFDDQSGFEIFLGNFPHSAWTGSLLLHIGVEYYNYGYYSKALDSWEKAWQILKESDDPRGKPQADRAAGELARMYSKLGRMDQLSQLLNSIEDRSLIGPGVQLIHNAQQAMWLMQNRPGICFKCGPMALDSILSQEDPAKAGNALILQAQSSTNGFSLPVAQP